MTRAKSRALAVAALAAGVSALAAVGPAGRLLDPEVGGYLLVRLRGPVERPPDAAVIVAQDRASATALGEPTLDHWPRRDLARVVRQVTAAGARALALDLLLTRPTTDDEALAAAIAASGRVVLVEATSQTEEAARSAAPSVLTQTAQPPLPTLAAAAALTAPHPVSRGWLHVPAFWVFAPWAGGRPTLPAAALLVAALADGPAQDALAAAAEAGGMPDIAALARSAAPLPARITSLRRHLARDRAGAAWLRARIAAQSGDDPLAAEVAGAAVAMLAGPASRLLVPYGPPGRVARVSYRDVEAGDPAALTALRGRIAFVGASDLGERVQQHDSFPSAFPRPNGVGMAGIEVAATACLNLLAGDAAMPAPRKVTAALAGGAAALAATAGGLMPPVWALSTVLAAGVAVAFAGAWLLVAWHVALPLGSALAAMLVVGLPTGLLVRQGAVRRQLDRAVAALTLGHVRRARPLAGLEDVATRSVRWCVCLATDLTDYVRLTEALAGREPDLAELVARYRAVLHQVVEGAGGFVLNLAGDASVCLWEADAPDPVLRERATHAALALVVALDGFAAERGMTGHPTRVGLAAGWVVVGNFAQRGGFSFAGVGEPINLASRLEQLNKQLGTRVLAAADVVAGLGGLPFRPVGAHQLKGMAQPREVVALDPALPVRNVTTRDPAGC